MSAKSFKADGTPKQRWSASERAARGNPPRRRGGVPRSDARALAGPARTSPARTSPARTDARPPREVREAREPNAAAAGRSFTRTERDQSPRTSGYRDERPRTEWSARPRTASHREDRPRTSGYRDDRPRTSGYRDDRPRTENRSDSPRTGSYREDRPRTAAPVKRWPAPDRAERPPRAARDDRRDRRELRDEPAVRPHREPNRPALEPEFGAPPADVGDFGTLGVPPALAAALHAQGITAPFPIQVATIPDALAGRDVLGRGRTGSGKTLAFGLPMIIRLAGGVASVPRGLVLVPTRELAMQVTEVLVPLAKLVDLSVILVAGGMSYTPQLRALQRGVDIVVATPGRLIDLMDQGALDLTRVEITVLDEADHMADLGFMPAVTQILDVVPAGGQRLLFSATLDQAIDRLVRQYLQTPVTHQVDTTQASITTMSHHLVNVAPKDKAQVTAEIAGRAGRTVVFVRTQRGADRVAEQLRESGVMAGSLHGGLTQGARTRILSVFKDGELPVLVATDVAARGIHVDEVGLVLQVDPPAGPKEYLHRAGRTARAGGSGSVVTLVLPHQRRELTRLTSQAGVHASTLSGEPGAADLAAATGAQVPTGVAVSSAAYQRLIAPPPAHRRSPADRPRGRSFSSRGGPRNDGSGSRSARGSRSR